MLEDFHEKYLVIKKDLNWRWVQKTWWFTFVGEDLNEGSDPKEKNYLILAGSVMGYRTVGLKNS